MPNAIMREVSEVWEDLLRIIEPQANTAFMGAPELTEIGWRAQFFIPRDDETAFQADISQLYNVQYTMDSHVLMIAPVAIGLALPVHLTRERVIELARELLDALLVAEP